MIIDQSTFEISKPSFIVFEGGNGVGKSTLIKSIHSYLVLLNQKVLITREPGGTLLGEKIRAIVKDDISLNIDPISELCLFAADRAQHVNTKIIPALKDNNFVLCDRFFYSTLAFQGAGRKVDPKIVQSTIDIAVGSLVPDLVVLIDLSIEEAIKRQNKRADKEDDRFEKEDLKFQENIRQSFLEQANSSKEPWCILDGTNSPEELTKNLLKLIKLPH